MIAVYGDIEFYCKKKVVNFFLVCRLRVNQTNK